MSYIYIANLTKQNHVFYYRVPEEPKSYGPLPFRADIRAGSQVRLPKDYNPAQVEGILAPHRNYGLVEVKEIDRTKPFIGLCYSLDRPVPLEAIQRGIQHNDEVLIEQGKENRAKAAIAVHNMVTDPGVAGGERPDVLEMSVIQENQEDYSGEGEPVAEVISVTDEGKAPLNPAARSAGKRGRR